MLHNKTKKKHHYRAPSSALATADAHLWSPVIHDVTITLAIGPSRGTNGEELVQQGLHRTLHGVSNSGVGVGVHGLEQGSEVEAGILEIRVAEGARQG